MLRPTEISRINLDFPLAQSRRFVAEWSTVRNIETSLRLSINRQVFPNIHTTWICSGPYPLCQRSVDKRFDSNSGFAVRMEAAGDA